MELPSLRSGDGVLIDALFLFQCLAFARADLQVRSSRSQEGREKLAVARRARRNGGELLIRGGALRAPPLAVPLGSVFDVGGALVGLPTCLRDGSTSSTRYAGLERGLPPRRSERKGWSAFLRSGSFRCVESMQRLEREPGAAISAGWCSLRMSFRDISLDACSILQHSFVTSSRELSDWVGERSGREPGSAGRSGERVCVWCYSVPLDVVPTSIRLHSALKKIVDGTGRGSARAGSASIGARH